MWGLHKWGKTVRQVTEAVLLKPVFTQASHAAFMSYPDMQITLLALLEGNKGDWALWHLGPKHLVFLLVSLGMPCESYSGHNVDITLVKFRQKHHFYFNFKYKFCFVRFRKLQSLGQK